MEDSGHFDGLNNGLSFAVGSPFSFRSYNCRVMILLELLKQWISVGFDVIGGQRNPL